MSDEGEGGDMTDIEGRNMSSLSEEEEERTSTDEEAQERPCVSETEVESVDGDEERLEGEGEGDSPFTSPLRIRGAGTVSQTGTDQTED